MKYPDHPGTKSLTGPSAESAVLIAGHAKILRRQVLQEFVLAYPESLSADQVAYRLSKSILSVRPRVSELRAAGLVEGTTGRAVNMSGHRSTRWRATQLAMRPAQ